MHESKPLSIQSIAPMFCTFLHVATHLLHKIHLLKSRTIDGDLSSTICCDISPLNSTFNTLNFIAKFCSSQFP